LPIVTRGIEQTDKIFVLTPVHLGYFTRQRKTISFILNDVKEGVGLVQHRFVEMTIERLA
jgi:hypothetical protein